MGNAVFNIAIQFTLYLLDFIISYHFFAFLSHKKYKFYINATVIIALSLLFAILNGFLQPNLLRKTSTFVALYLIGFFLFETNIKTLLFRVTILMFTGILSEEIIEGLNNLFLRERYIFISIINFYYIYKSLAGKIIWFSSIRIILRFNRHNKNLSSLYGMNFVLLLPSILIMSTIEMVSLSSLQYTSYINLLVVIVIGLLGLLSCIVIFRIYEFSLVQNELTDNLLRKQANIDYYDAQVQNQEILTNRHHEYKNSLITIRGMLGSNIDPDINAYLNELIGSFSVEEELAITENFNNKILNAILNYNRDTCKTQEIQLDIDIQYSDMGFLRPLDTGILLNNSFNNAVEACNRMPSGSDKWIKLKICLLHDELIIAMRNSKINTIIQNHSRIISTKRSAISTGHGCGIINMKECAARYNGSLNITDGGDYFELFIRLKCIHI